MAFNTRVRFGKRRVFHKIFVGGFPVGIIRISPMAGDTPYFTVIFVFFQKFIIDEKFFVRSQRLHLPASAWSLGFRFGNRPCFCNFSCNFNEFSRACVALYTLTFFCNSKSNICKPCNGSKNGTHKLNLFGKNHLMAFVSRNFSARNRMRLSKGIHFIRKFNATWTNRRKYLYLIEINSTFKTAHDLTKGFYSCIFTDV